MGMTAEEFASWCLSELPPAIISDEETREILSDFYTAIGSVQTSIDDKREGLADLLNPDTCPENCLNALLSLVGFGARTPWVWGMTTTEKRVLAYVARDIWKNKGTPDATRALCRMMSPGGEVAIYDWPFWRYVPGVPFAGILSWPSVASGGDCEALLHISDPYTSANRTRAQSAIRMIQPGTDTWHLIWCHLSEVFLQGLSRYDVTGSPSCEVGAGEIVLGDGDGIVSAFGVEATEWGTNRVLANFQIETGTTFDIDFCRVDDDNHFRARVTSTGVEIIAVQAGVSTSLATLSATVLVDFWHLIDIRISELSTGALEVRVWLNGTYLGLGVLY